jgi:hypothetical protein
MLYGRLLDENCRYCESLADLSYPGVLPQSRESRGDRFIKSFCGDLYGVLNVLEILNRDCTRSEDHIESVAYSPFVRYEDVAPRKASM